MAPGRAVCLSQVYKDMSSYYKDIKILFTSLLTLKIFLAVYITLNAIETIITRGCSMKEVLLKTLLNSQEHLCWCLSFLKVHLDRFKNFTICSDSYKNKTLKMLHSYKSKDSPVISS